MRGAALGDVVASLDWIMTSPEGGAKGVKRETGESVNSSLSLPSRLAGKERPNKILANIELARKPNQANHDIGKAFGCGGALKECQALRIKIIQFAAQCRALWMRRMKIFSALVCSSHRH